MLLASADLKNSSQASNIRWMGPQLNYFKLNVDAAFYPTTREASMGIVVHDHWGVIHI